MPIDDFADIGLIPNQYNELSINMNDAHGQTKQRLNLSSNDNSLNIRFARERVDFTLTNINIGVFEMPSVEEFVKSYEDIYRRINKRYPKVFKRIGFVSQYLINDVAINDVASKFNNSPTFFNSGNLLEYSHKNVNRITLQVKEEEIINVGGELRWLLNTPMKINNKEILFNGPLITIDVNTLAEKEEYRLDFDGTLKILHEVVKIGNEIEEQYTEMLK